MKKWILFAVMALLCSPVLAWNGSSGFDTGTLQAQSVTVDCTNFSSNLTCADTNVQHALNTIDLLTTGASGGTVGIGTTNRVGRYPANGTTIVASTVLIDNGTNIGVGTTVPAGLLDVNRKFTVLSGGNVGIGSITPGAPLDVQGAIRGSSTINNITFTPPASASTLTLASGKTVTFSNTLVFAGTDSTTMTFPGTSATIARTDAANTFTGHQTIEGVTSTGATGTGNLVFGSGPTITLANGTGLPISTGVSGLGSNVATFLATPSSANMAAAITDEVGTGFSVFNASPNFTGNVGVGTTIPQFAFQINGNVGIGTKTPNSTSNTLFINNAAGFSTEYFAGNVGIGTTTINLNNGSYQYVGLGTTQNGHIAFTPPSNGSAMTLNLRLLQDSTGSRLVDFPATTLWTGGAAFTFTTTANKADRCSFFWNGTNYYAQCLPNY